MAIASEQNIPNKPTKSEPWTLKRLFPLSTINSISKVFASPLEVLLGFVIFVMGVAILFWQLVPVLFYFLAACLLASVVYERMNRPPEVKTKKEKNAR